MFSDEGQTYLALAGAIPTREDFTIADEYKDQVISKDDIANAVLISDADAYSAACETAKDTLGRRGCAITGTVMQNR